MKVMFRDFPKRKAQKEFFPLGLLTKRNAASRYTISFLTPHKSACEKTPQHYPSFIQTLLSVPASIPDQPFGSRTLAHANTAGRELHPALKEISYSFLQFYYKQ
jgi:hypothetical protein